jgi:chaperonin GroEL (HSP60 family)
MEKNKTENRFQHLDVMQQLKDTMISHCEVVGTTFGPKGQNVLISPANGRPPFFARDGVTVVKHLAHLDLAALLLADVCNATVKRAGDGTTSTALLVGECLKDGVNPLPFLEAALKVVENEKFPAGKDDIKNVAVSVARNPEIAEMLAEVIYTLGPDGLIKAEAGKKTAVEIRKGYNLGTGVLTQQFLDPPRIWECVKVSHERVTLIKPYIVIIEEKISNEELLEKVFLAYVTQCFNKNTNTYMNPLLIIAADISHQALNGLVGNLMHHPRHRAPVFAVKSPAGGFRRMDILKDISYLTSAPIYSKHAGMVLKNFKGSFGVSDAAELSIDETIIVVDDGNFQERIDTIKSTQDVDDPFIQERISKLRGAVGVVTFGEGVFAHMKSLELQVEDVILACQRALKHGYIRGGRYIWEKLADAVPELYGVFSRIGVRLPLTPAHDSVETLRAALENAFTLVDQIETTGHIVDNVKRD